jgi:biotin carboxyl carrier protein
MKSYRIQLDGETFDIEILGDPCQDQVDVKIDGKTVSVKILSLDDGSESTDSRPSARPSVHPADSLPNKDAGRPSPSPETRQSPIGDRVLRSPLPGTITEITVRPGQLVHMGDELLVIEAMKMNNKIRSSRAGIIEQVMVNVGEQVSHGATLLSWVD